MTLKTHPELEGLNQSVFMCWNDPNRPQLNLIENLWQDLMINVHQCSPSSLIGRRQNTNGYHNFLIFIFIFKKMFFLLAAFTYMIVSL